MLNLYNYSRSSASFRVRIALNLKKLAYQEIFIDLLKGDGEQFSPEYQAINPQSLVPALEDNGKIITQSMSIMEYLEELHPSPSILPRDTYEKSLVRSFALSIVADIHPLNNRRVLKYLLAEMGLSEEKKTQWYQHWIATGLNALEKQLISSKTMGTYCVGDFPTMADICLVPQIYNARRFSCDLSACPTLVRIDAECQKHPAFMSAWPKDL